MAPPVFGLSGTLRGRIATLAWHSPAATQPGGLVRQMAVYFGHPGASALSIRARSGPGSFLPGLAPMRYTRAMQAACGLLSAFALRAPAQVHLALARFPAAADGLPAGRRRGKRPTNEKQIGRMAFA